jgi:hypothetical protein
MFFLINCKISKLFVLPFVLLFKLTNVISISPIIDAPSFSKLLVTVMLLVASVKISLTECDAVESSLNIISYKTYVSDIDGVFCVCGGTNFVKTCPPKSEGKVILY